MSTGLPTQQVASPDSESRQTGLMGSTHGHALLPQSPTPLWVAALAVQADCTAAGQDPVFGI